MTPAPLFDVIRNNRLMRLPLNKLSADEVLGLANAHLRGGDERTATMLYRHQHKMQYEPRRPAPRPQGRGR